MNNKLLFAVLIVALVVGVSFFIRMNQSGFDAGNLPGNQENSAQDNSIYGVDDEEDEDEDEDEIEDDEEDDDSISTTITPSSNQTNKSVILTELSNHNAKSDCWVAYGGKVYDITSFLPKHPGSSAAIQPYCGTADEFKAAFENKHGTSKVSNLMKMGVLIGDFDIMGNV